MDYKFIFFIIFILFSVLIYLFIYNKSNTYIGKSNINGNGLIANKIIKKNEIILENIFPNKPNNLILNKIVLKSKFNDFISSEGKYINHCSHNYNSNVISNDKKIYKLVANKTIYPNEEITTNYDLTHKKYPFIGGSEKKYKSC